MSAHRLTRAALVAVIANALVTSIVPVLGFAWWFYQFRTGQAPNREVGDVMFTVLGAAAALALAPLWLLWLLAMFCARDAYEEVGSTAGWHDENRRGVFYLLVVLAR